MRGTAHTSRWPCLLAFTLVALLGLTACGSDDGGGQRDRPIELSLEVPPRVEANETVALKLVAKNVSDWPVQLGPGRGEDNGFGLYDFAVSTPDGAPVWNLLSSNARDAVPSSKTLNPGEELVLEGQWNQTNSGGSLVALGRYLVRGFVSIKREVDSSHERPAQLFETETKPLVVGQGFHPLTLSLQMPSEVSAGETVPLRLVAKNVTDAPVELGLTGREDTGFAGSYDFVVSTADGVEVWSLNAGKVFQAILSVKSLSPGWQLTFAGEWNQAGAQGTPVAAGKYVVRGILDTRLDVSTPSERGLTLETEAKPLVVVAE